MCLSLCMFSSCGPSLLTPLTCHGKASQWAGLSLGLAHPFLAALPGNLDLPRHGAVRPGQHHVQVAAGQAADLPVTTHTLVLTAGEEGLAILVDGSTQNTHMSPMSCRKERKWAERFCLIFYVLSILPCSGHLVCTCE